MSRKNPRHTLNVDVAHPQGQITSYVYDSLNRLSSLSANSQTFGFSYDALSRRTQLTRPNGVNTNYSYDNLSRLLSVLHQVGVNTLDGAVYTYDSAGNRLSKADQLAGITSSFSYDPLNGVTQGPTTTESYTYDAVGNRLSSLGLSPYQYNSSNELTSTPTTTYTYDKNGELKTKVDSTGTTTYNWDTTYRNLLTSIVLPGSGGTVSFRYDPFGRRIQKSGPTGTTNYLYDGGNLLEEVDNSGNVLARYIQGPGIDDPLAELRAGTTSYYEQDGLGSVSSLSSFSGAIASAYTYNSYGSLTTSIGTVANPFRFTGRESDSETGLYYNRARYYDPAIGRFISEDPLGFFGGGVNFFGYAANRPTEFGDASGLAYSTYQSVIAPVIYVNASITIYGPGATDALAAQWQQWITNTWNQNPGSGTCKVVFNVQVMADSTATHWWNAASNPEFPGANNFIYVPRGMPGNPSINLGQWTGTIPADTLQFSVSHEFGHLLGLLDARPWFLLPWRDPNDIMAEGNTVTQYDINGIVRPKPPCGCN